MHCQCVNDSIISLNKRSLASPDELESCSIQAGLGDCTDISFISITHFRTKCWINYTFLDIMLNKSHIFGHNVELITQFCYGTLFLGLGPWPKHLKACTKSNDLHYFSEELGKGPCATNFGGTECPFYPDLPIIQAII